MGTNTPKISARHQNGHLPTHSDTGILHPTIEAMNATLARNLASHIGTPAPAPRSEKANEYRVRLSIRMPRSEEESDAEMSRDVRGWESEGTVSADENEDEDGEGRRDSAFGKVCAERKLGV
ncbi:hypothetical protein SNOG_04799 [Parastagonospora nodorum SN15]|uniref:Uncharacterized protein n=1 Tax=Phaeosphaeria nodorum (strain SN15 / ATCC MYA-4574 / FGSC 10173) TaxID=321614 RepID=Q0UTW5_PHANO|nr:hypothetical protein SNOG_04799 [Parastagonospora nodorum SN15]EAT87190.1 hypothetical protein SNOG_04799 [Parastagonospora nodorum SN15]